MGSEGQQDAAKYRLLISGWILCPDLNLVASDAAAVLPFTHLADGEDDLSACRPSSPVSPSDFLTCSRHMAICSLRMFEGKTFVISQFQSVFSSFAAVIIIISDR